VQTSFLAGGVDNATSSASIHLKFDRYLLPASVARQSICVRAASTPVVAPGDCTLGPFLGPAYDPVKREVILRLSQGARLDRDAEYQVTLLTPAEDGAPGIRAFDGAPLEAPLEFAFSTAATDPAGAPPDGQDEPAYEELDPFCTVSARCLAGCGADTACQASCQSAQTTFLNCAFGECHADGSRTIEGVEGRAYVGPAMGLVLCTSSNLACPDKYLSPILGTAIGQVARQTQQGDALTADLSPVAPEARRFGRAMPIVDPNNPGNSYLIYKILAGFDPMTASDGNVAAVGEQNRMREALVVGLAMPANGNDLSPLPGPAVSEIQLLSNWIARGAPTKTCP
jgi:hypothetical protein